MGLKSILQVALAASVVLGMTSVASAKKADSKEIFEKVFADSLDEKADRQRDYRRHMPRDDQKIRKALAGISVEIGDELGSPTPKKTAKHKIAKPKAEFNDVANARSLEKEAEELDQLFPQAR